MMSANDLVTPISLGRQLANEIFDFSPYFDGGETHAEFDVIFATDIFPTHLRFAHDRLRMMGFSWFLSEDPEGLTEFELTFLNVLKGNALLAYTLYKIGKESKGA